MTSPIPDLNGLRVAWQTRTHAGTEYHEALIHLPLIPLRDDKGGLHFIPLASLVRVEGER